MKKVRSGFPAEPGRLSPTLHSQLVQWVAFAVQRDKGLVDLLGPQALRSRLPIEMIRLVLAEFGYDRRQRISFYQKELARYASRSAVREEAHRLTKRSVLLLENDPTDQRSLIIVATTRLVDCFSVHAKRFNTWAAGNFLDQ